MQDAVGKFIDGGEPDTGNDTDTAYSDTRGTDESTGGIGSDSYTAPVGEFPKLTKSGRIDKRTLRTGPRGPRGAGARSDSASTGEEAGKVHLSKLDIGELLFSIHLTLSEFTGWEELQLEKEESKELGGAVREFAKFYGVSFDPKKVALFNLCLVAGKLYIPRAIAIKNRLSETSAKGPQLVQQPKPTINDVPMPPQTVSLSGMAPSDIWQEGFWQERGAL
jgi:hypothetical protein